MERVSIQGDRFFRAGAAFTLWGFNYWHSDSPGSDPDGGDWSVLCRYNPSVIEREVGAMAQAGANTVRVWFGYSPENWSVDNCLTPMGLANLRHFFDCCEQYGLYVLLTVGGAGSLWGITRGFGDVFVNEASRFYCDQQWQELFLADVLMLITQAELSGRVNLLAIDLANEPVFGIPKDKADRLDMTWRTSKDVNFHGSLRHAQVCAAWSDWVCRTHGSAQTAVQTWGLDATEAARGAVAEYPGLPIPEAADFLTKDGRVRLAADYHRFVEERFRLHCTFMSEALHAQCREFLVTIGFGCGGTGAEFEGGSESERVQKLMLTQNVRQMSAGLDFVCVHLYNNTTLEKMAFLREYLGSEKPVVIEEFGYIPQCVDPLTGCEAESDYQAQTTFWKLILRGTHENNYAGALGCNFTDTGNPEPARNVWSRMGIVDRMGKPKPALTEVRDYFTAHPVALERHPQALPIEDGIHQTPVHLYGTLFQKWRSGKGE